MLFVVIATNGQSLLYPYFYRVTFRDKGNYTSIGYSASDLLSARAINRRKIEGISVPDFKDIPIDKSYISKISLLGLKLHSTSKWMNTALFKSQSEVNINTILSFPFVSDVKIVKNQGTKNFHRNKLDFEIEASDPASFDRPLTMVNGIALHNSGFDGSGTLVAILDGGFLNADKINSLAGIRSRKGIKATHDFVINNGTVYNASNHGTAVLSVLAGNIPGFIEGSAPGADFLLLKTEDVDSEFPCEEDFWAAGAEYADSAGADIISSSLGYFMFDDSTMNYKVSGLNGNTAFVTRAADIAASKGILVINSAGNERNDIWKYIIFPSDGDSVLAAGAVNGSNIIADFSSAGSPFDRRIKPDNVAMGVSIPVQINENIINRSSGTSFSCPVLSGMAACLLQAVPRASKNDIIDAFHRSADRYNSPDFLYGYGIPDMVQAIGYLQDKYLKIPESGPIISPNPTSGNFEIIFPTPPQKVTIEIFSVSGKIIFRKDFADYAGRTIFVTELQHAEQGLYLIRITSDTGKTVRKIIKTKTDHD
jgi:subtilisin family serine protease